MCEQISFFISIMEFGKEWKRVVIIIINNINLFGNIFYKYLNRKLIILCLFYIEIFQVDDGYKIKPHYEEKKIIYTKYFICEFSPLTKLLFLYLIILFYFYLFLLLISWEKSVNWARYEWRISVLSFVKC